MKIPYNWPPRENKEIFNEKGGNYGQFGYQHFLNNFLNRKNCGKNWDILFFKNFESLCISRAKQI